MRWLSFLLTNAASLFPLAHPFDFTIFQPLMLFLDCTSTGADSAVVCLCRKLPGENPGHELTLLVGDNRTMTQKQCPFSTYRVSQNHSGLMKTKKGKKSSNKNWEQGSAWWKVEIKFEKATTGIHGVRSSPRKVRSCFKEEKAVALILGYRKAVRLHQACNLWVIILLYWKVLPDLLRPLRMRHSCSRAMCASGTSLQQG